MNELGKGRTEAHAEQSAHTSPEMGRPIPAVADDEPKIGRPTSAPDESRDEQRDGTGLIDGEPPLAPPRSDRMPSDELETYDGEPPLHRAAGAETGWTLTESGTSDQVELAQEVFPRPGADGSECLADGEP